MSDKGSNRHYRRWTDVECKKVLTLRSEGKSFDEIAHIMGRTHHSVKNKHDATIRSVKSAGRLRHTMDDKDVPSREQLLKELLPELNAIFGHEYERHKKEHSKTLRAPTLFERIKRWLGMGR